MNHQVNSQTSILALAALLAVIALAGCATQSAVQVVEPFVSSKHYQVRIEPCQDRTGFTERDLAGEATRLLSEKVTSTKVFVIADDAPVLLTCDIERFAEGSAFKRWLLPGWGATQAAVTVMVLQKAESKTLAVLRSQASVETGGLYTIGADQYILSVALNDIVRQLEEWAKGAAQ
jgi:hypothetical protein